MSTMISSSPPAERDLCFFILNFSGVLLGSMEKMSTVEKNRNDPLLSLIAFHGHVIFLTP